MDATLAADVHRLYESAWRDGTSWDTSMKEAARLLQEHLRDDPECVEALTCLGAVLSDTGRHREAVVVLRQARALGSTDSNTYYNLGAALMNVDAAGRRSARASFRRSEAFARNAITLRAYFDPHGH